MLAMPAELALSPSDGGVGMRKFGVGALGALVLVAVVTPAAEAKRHASAATYVVAYEKGVGLARAERAARRIGGRVVATRAALRIMLVRSSHRGFPRVRERLRSTATNHGCPTPATVDYTIVDRPSSWNATCLGNLEYNGFYGDGIVNALAAVTG
jgi:hypothetical protein